MSVQQTGEAATRAWEDAIMACIQAERDFWTVAGRRDGQTVRWFAHLIGWDDMTAFPVVLHEAGCASYEHALERATRWNEQRARGGQEA